VVNLLKAHGIVAHPVAQEHSAVPTLFLSQGPRRVVVLSAAFSTVRRRRRLNWTAAHYRQQWMRLRQAHLAANLIVRTDSLTAEEVAEVIVLWSDGMTGLRQLWSSLPGASAEDRAALRYAVTCGAKIADLRGTDEELRSARCHFETFWQGRATGPLGIDTDLHPGL
jgi:hypothetical protein